MSLVEKFAVLVESTEIADALKKIFEFAWSEASGLQKARSSKKVTKL